MRSWFVFYNDGYACNGDVGIQKFETCDAALQFISERIRTPSGQSGRDARNISDYTLIEGKEHPIKAAETVTKVILDK